MRAREVIEAAHAAVPAHPPALVRQAEKGVDRSSQDIVAACLVGEAGGEGAQGMQAVMNVIYNRAGGHASKFAKVALKPRQFSMFNRTQGKHPARSVAQVVAAAKKHPCWEQARVMVQQAASGRLADITRGANHYHEKSISPEWADPKCMTVQIGRHVFYRNSVAEQLLSFLV